MEVYPYLVESFHNHGGTVIKCYAIDSEVFIRVKPSLPDIVKHDCENESGTGRSLTLDNPKGEVAFHTLTNMPCVAAEAVSTAVVKDAMTVEAAQKCAAVIRKTTGLSLFGFDLTVPSRWTRFLLVDVNAFPSFKGIPEASEALRVFVQRKCKR